MELTIVAPDAPTLDLAMGISDARSTELLDLMNLHVVPLYEHAKKHDLYTHTSYVKIAEFCDTPEELVYCTTAYNGWFSVRRLLPALNRWIISYGSFPFTKT